MKSASVGALRIHGMDITTHDDGDRLTVACVLSVPDRDDPSSVISVTTRMRIPTEASDDDFTDAVRTVIENALRHEVDEFLVINGMKNRDPHSPPELP